MNFTNSIRTLLLCYFFTHANLIKNQQILNFANFVQMIFYDEEGALRLFNRLFP